jgi:uncharacterized membrane protein
VTGPSRRLAALFLLALAGVAVVVGIVVAELGGPPALGGYALAVLVLAGAGAVRGRRAAARQARPARCSCCDGDHTAPVRVV